VVDLRPALTRAQTEQILYEKLLRGEILSVKQARTLMPSREEFAGLWRYLRRHATDNRLEESVCRLTHCVGRTYGFRTAVTRTLICLDVLDDCGLIELERRTDCVSIVVHETTDKVNLEQSSVMRRLRSMSAE
jgi:single-stranded-DNA-specific exonuclease